MSVKYRRLTSEELSELEKEFIDFLIVNGITADLWLAMKSKETEKAERMVELFSDVIFEGTLRKTQYADHVSASSMYSFHFLEREIHLVGVEDTIGQLDFTQKDTLTKLSQSIPKGLKVFFEAKNFKVDRQKDIFDLTTNGAEISDGQLFKQLSLLYAVSQDSA